MAMPDLTRFKNLEWLLDELERRYGITDLLKWRVRELLSKHGQTNPANRREYIYPPEAVEWLADYRRTGKPIPD